MMTTEQARTVGQVYRRFMESEEHRGWTGIDDYMDHLEYLDDDQLHREADVVHSGQVNRNARCDQQHDKTECFVPTIIEAVGAILSLYKESGHLHKNNKYVLQYYLAISQAGMILVD